MMLFGQTFFFLLWPKLSLKLDASFFFQLLSSYKSDSRSHQIHCLVCWLVKTVMWLTVILSFTGHQVWTLSPVYQQFMGVDQRSFHLISVMFVCGGTTWCMVVVHTHAHHLTVLICQTRMEGEFIGWKSNVQGSN